MRMILIEVDDDRSADKLVDRFSQMQTARVVGFFQVPRSRCKCVGYSQSSHRAPNYKRSLIGSLFKWRVHDQCGKVSWGNHSLKNLMPKSDRRQGAMAPHTYVDTILMHDKGFYRDDPK